VTDTDVLVIGGGIAGVSAACFIAPRLRVILVEQEATLSYHTTGRSAALFYENYGAAPMRSLTKASREFFEHPTEELAPFSRRGALTVATPEQLPALGAMFPETGQRTPWLSPSEAVELIPVLRPDYMGGAVLSSDVFDLDVAAIHQWYVHGIRRAGGEIRTGAGVSVLQRRGERWKVKAGEEMITAELVVNAAGAWCDVVAASAGIPPIGLQPKRRTAFMVGGSEDWRHWPIVDDVEERFYFKPDGSQVLCSLADETPSPPCDARPEEIDVALAIDRINSATTLGIRSVNSAWAGLRSFTSDRVMVIGFDESAPGFFWLAAQGGTGIQTSPATGRLAAGLVVDGAVPEDLAAAGVRAGDFAPGRLATRAAGQ
jgi:D-arginine dehydrogenase